MLFSYKRKWISIIAFVPKSKEHVGAFMGFSVALIASVISAFFALIAWNMIG